MWLYSKRLLVVNCMINFDVNLSLLFNIISLFADQKPSLVKDPFAGNGMLQPSMVSFFVGKWREAFSVGTNQLLTLNHQLP